MLYFLLQDPQLYLVALGGLLLAAKMEEKDGNIPKCTRLNSFVKNYFPLSDYYSIELVMLNYFDWNLCLPTACYFAMSLLPYAILETDRLVSGPILHPGKAHAYLEEYVSYFLRVSVSEMGFLDKLPSVVGVSVVAAARHVECIKKYYELLSSIQNYPQNVPLDIGRILLVSKIIYASYRLSGRRSGCWRPGPTGWRACPGTVGRSCSPW